MKIRNVFGAIKRNFLRKNAVFIVESFYKGFWNLRSQMYGGGYSKMKEFLYFSYLEHYGSWIGLGATFDGTPVFPHGLFGVFISNSAHIGKNVVIFHQVTIGSNMIKGGKNNGAPTVGDNVYIGCGAKLIGNINIGRNARIGANCVVVKDVPENSVTVIRGVESIKKDYELDNEWVVNDYKMQGKE